MAESDKPQLTHGCTPPVATGRPETVGGVTTSRADSAHNASRPPVAAAGRLRNGSPADGASPGRVGHCGSAFGSGTVAAAGIDGEIGGVAGCSMVGSGAIIRQVGCWMTSTGSGAGVGSGSTAGSAATGSGSPTTASSRDLDSGWMRTASRFRSASTAARLDLGLVGGEGSRGDHGLRGDRSGVGFGGRRRDDVILFVRVELRVQVLTGAESTEETARLRSASLACVRLVIGGIHRRSGRAPRRESRGDLGRLAGLVALGGSLGDDRDVGGFDFGNRLGGERLVGDRLGGNRLRRRLGGDARRPPAGRRLVGDRLGGHRLVDLDRGHGGLGGQRSASAVMVSSTGASTAEASPR